MSRTFTVVLGGETYTLRPFNVDQLERLVDMVEATTPRKAGFAILRLAMERAEPKVANLGEIELTQQELTNAYTKIMEASGMRQSGEAVPATGA